MDVGPDSPRAASEESMMMTSDVANQARCRESEDAALGGAAHCCVTGASEKDKKSNLLDEKSSFGMADPAPQLNMVSSLDGLPDVFNNNPTDMMSFTAMTSTGCYEMSGADSSTLNSHAGQTLQSSPMDENEDQSLSAQGSELCSPVDGASSISEASTGGATSSTVSGGSSESFQLTLQTLPPELFLHVCSFLHAKFVVRTLALVCKSFHAIINNVSTWKIRIGKRWPKKYPPVSVSDLSFNWVEACIQREEEHRVWSQYPSSTDYFCFREGVFASVDSVHLMQNGRFLAVGSRDRYLNVLDLNKLDSSNPAESVRDAHMFMKMNAHKGWIWSMSSVDNVLATGSWDAKIKFWDIHQNGEVLQTVQCKSAILCSHYEPTFMVAGGYDKKVYHIDPRSASILEEKRYHKKPVLCLGASDNYFITGSEDSTVTMYDRREQGIVSTLQMERYPMCLSYGWNQVWVGDKKGQLHLIDTASGVLSLIDSFDIGHQSKMTGVHHTLGAVYTCSCDSDIKVLEPSLNPTVINTVKDAKGQLAMIDFQNDTLVCASSEPSVGIWRPR